MNGRKFTHHRDCLAGNRCNRATRCPNCSKILQDGESITAPMVLMDGVQAAISAAPAQDDATKRQREIADAQAVRDQSYADYKNRMSWQHRMAHPAAE